MSPARFDVTRFLAGVGSLDFGPVPERYRQAMRDYLGQGVLPGEPLRLLLEGDVGAISRFRDDLPGLADLADWMDAALPAACWGSRDQVQLWVVYVRRARGRALLATFDEGAPHG
jgi:hypothetical protein